jgi:hypothetical protein
MYGRADGMPSSLESVVVCEGKSLKCKYEDNTIVLS